MEEKFEYLDKEEGSLLEISSTHEDWNKSKEMQNKHMPFFLSVAGDLLDDYVCEVSTFDIDTAKDIVKFLQEKIDFLEKPKTMNKDTLDSLKKSMNELDDESELNVEDFELEVFFDIKRVYKEQGHDTTVILLNNMVNNNMNIRVNTPMKLVGIMKHNLPHRESVYDLRVEFEGKEHLIKESLLTIVE